VATFTARIPTLESEFARVEAAANPVSRGDNQPGRRWRPTCPSRHAYPMAAPPSEANIKSDKQSCRCAHGRSIQRKLDFVLGASNGLARKALIISTCALPQYWVSRY
jgi:hypothetical protein